MMIQSVRYPTKFKKIIEERKLTYGSLSAVTGITRQALGNYALGLRKPDIHTACIIIRTLNLDISIIETLFEPTN